MGIIPLDILERIETYEVISHRYTSTTINTINEFKNQGYLIIVPPYRFEDMDNTVAVVAKLKPSPIKEL